jgi:adenylate cyclase
MHLADQLSRYLSPYLNDSIFKGHQQATMESQTKDLTVFFSDIAGFTRLSKSMEPTELTTWLNIYPHAMTEIASKDGGTLDKFEGDAVMVFFGAPESRGIEQDALSCVQMAQEMQAKASEMDIKVRMGISSKPCTDGNFGSVHHRDYTIIGPVVNTVARLETNSEPGRILITGTTYDRVHKSIGYKEREVIRVKGRDRELNTYWITD